MTPRLSACLLVGAPLVAVSLLHAQVFRASVNGVTLDVVVRRGAANVSGLRASDFDVRDNGVVQRIDDVTPDSRPIDLTFAIDVSGSVMAGEREDVRAAVEKIGTSLRADDRSRVLTFERSVTERRPMQSGPLVIDPFVHERVGGTALFEAAAMALVTPSDPERRRVAIVLTDGWENASFIDDASFIEVAERADSVLDMIIVTPGAPVLTLDQRARWKAESTAVDATGGRMTFVKGGGDLAASFLQTLDEFRAGYLLRYTAAGVARAGWHTIDVRVTRSGSYDVHVRQGYFGR